MNKNLDLFELIKLLETVKIPISSEFLPIENSNRLVVADDVYASFDFPAQNRSKMDGFAFDKDNANLDKKLKIVGHLGANETYENNLKSDECVKCSTGSNLVKNQNAVVPIEYCTEENGYIKVDRDFKIRNQYIEKAGNIFKKGENLLVAGSVVDYRDIEQLALNRINAIKVYKMPSIGIISTGSELTEQYVAKSSIINSNYYMISSFLKSKMIPYSYLGVVNDEFEDIKLKIDEASEKYDIIVTFGGTAFGQKDLIKNVIKSLNGEIYGDGVNVSPGKTFKIAKIKGKPLFVFPGNPASASVCMEVFLNIFLNKNYYGINANFIDAKAKFTLKKKNGFYKFIPGFVEISGEELLFYDRLNIKNDKRYFQAVGIIDKEVENIKVNDLLKVYIIK